MEILKRLNKIKIEKKNLKKTHILFNNRILNILKITTSKIFKK